MNGHVFELHSERRDKSQFADTVKAMRVYASQSFKSDIDSLTILFKELKTPSVKIPEDPVETEGKVMDNNGDPAMVTSRFEEMKYAEKVKQWIRDDKSLKCTLTSLYHIAWGQCSKLMQNKLTMAKYFDNFNTSGDITALL